MSRLTGIIRIDSATSAETLETECYKKYEKSGKSFYLSQIASTVRWLSTATPDELTKRVGTATNTPPEAVTSAPSCSSLSSSSFNPVIEQANEEKVSGSIKSNSPVSRDTAPPPILSFSEFINRRKSTDNKVPTSKRPLSDGVSRGTEKKTKS
ncbi:ATP-dependent DNA helicase Q-like 3 [Sesamum angolense]|uniref:ATP-dependent DNA helicase Q-like 3 n=1 Tax=Sesamum angolense TaxID=2727404 RepID=A0AAE2BNC2_9LAMI|nr:ATP-dependent DNA helicase Q-like 3 [Sesamum angolense]